MSELSPQRRYELANLKTYTFRFNKKHDADVIAAIEHQDNKQGYVKQLVRADIERSKNMTNIKATNITVNGHRFDYQLTDGTLLHVSEWNGEKYIVGRGKDEQSYRPVYRFQDEGIDIESLEENSPEWCRATEIIRFD
jgi:hypothetical protein